MAIGDHRRHDEMDVTVEHIERVAKGKKAVGVQMRKIYGAGHRLRGIAESRAYFVSPEQWERVLIEMRREVDDVELHLKRLNEKQRGPRTWED